MKDYLIIGDFGMEGINAVKPGIGQVPAVKAVSTEEAQAQAVMAKADSVINASGAGPVPPEGAAKKLDFKA